MALTSIAAKPQAIDYYDIVWQVDDNTGFNVQYENRYITISDSLVSIKIRPEASNIAWSCDISNKTSDKVVIKWKDATMGNSSTSRVLFGDMRMFEISNEVPDGILYKNGSISKDILGEEYARNSYLSLVYFKDMKKAYKKYKLPQTCSVHINIPIEHNGVVKIFELVFRGEYSGKQSNK